MDALPNASMLNTQKSAIVEHCHFNDSFWTVHLPCVFGHWPGNWSVHLGCMPQNPESVVGLGGGGGHAGGRGSNRGLGIVLSVPAPLNKLSEVWWYGAHDRFPLIQSIGGTC